MPIRSKAQQRAMYAAASGKGKTDIPKKVAKEYIAATPKSAYAKMPETAKRKAAMKRKSS
jgi:bisphosphoglycerate-dependent phosphoglycerate mutase